MGNSGLLDELLPAYQRTSGVGVRAHWVGSGRALAMLAAGQADVAITHAPAAEQAALRVHPSWRYTKFMFNDFVIAGPPTDPAGIRGSSDATEAMRTIAGADVRFISRGDASGTHERELALWKAAGQAPKGARLVAAGSGMGTTLRIAAVMGAYTLTDRATFVQRQEVGLAILFENDALLINTYAVTLDGSAPAAAEAEQFADWLCAGSGREAIRQFRVGPGKIAVFEVWPAGRPRTNPIDLPR